MGTIYLEGICYSSGGGGGGASSADQVSLDDTNLAYEADDVQEAFEKVTKSLTYAEYQELTEEEKNNGTLYFITDVNGDGQSFQPVIYSEEEREIGVWTDGKPLYEKTCIFNPVALSNSATIAHGISNVDTIVWVDSFMTRSNNRTITFPFGSGYDKFSGFYADRTNLTFTGGDTWQSADYSHLYATIRYTKTTDTAGSGTWTPQGVPAVHYSTEEQVVGTWIDGSTLYEKTFYSDMTISYDSASAVTLNDTIPSNIEVVDIQAYFRGKNASGNQVYQSDSGRWFHYYYESTENKIYAAQIFTSAGVTNCKTYFTIRYTKSNT